jgi:glycosyltransferase involved in cell wall biosynthesis
MDICFLTETPAWGGAEAHTVDLAEVLAERGHRVRIVALGHGVYDEVGRRPGARFTVRRVPLARPVARLSWSECRALLADLPAGVGVLVRFGLAVGSLRLDLAARLHFRRYVVVEHSAAVLPPRTTGRYLFGLLPGLGLWWYRDLLLWHLRSRLAHRVVCVSRSARQRLIRAYHLPARKVVAIYNGIDPAKFRPGGERRAAARRAWGVPESAFVFGSVGRLHPEKGVDLAVEGLARLVRQRPERDLRLVLVGDGPARETLRQQVRALGLEERVVFAGHTARPWEAYPGLDVFLLPTHDEALSLALLEAMACGCCAIAMGVGGVPEVLSDPRTGWLVPGGDRARFVEAMGAALGRGDAERADMGRAARAHVVAGFDAERQYAALADLIEEVAPRAGLLGRGRAEPAPTAGRLA